MWDTAVSRRFPSVGQPTCRFDELVLEVFVDSLKGHSENYTTFDTLPAVLPSRPRTPQVLQCSDRVSSLMNRRPSTYADALPEVVQGTRHH